MSMVPKAFTGIPLAKERRFFGEHYERPKDKTHFINFFHIISTSQQHIPSNTSNIQKKTS